MLFILVGKEIRDRLSGAVDAFSRRNSSRHGLHHDLSRHRSLDDGPSSKDVVCVSSHYFLFVQLVFRFIFFINKWLWFWLLELLFLSNTWSLQQPDSDRARSSSRNGSALKRPVISSSRPNSSGEPTESRSSRLVSGSGRLSTTQRVQPGFEPSKSSSFTRAAGTRGGRDDALRSFELLSIGTGKRKWGVPVVKTLPSTFLRPFTPVHLLCIFQLCWGPFKG